jgi:tRNA 2-thiouridine synthesizing protein A
MNKLDLCGVKCPMNYVKAKLALEKLASGTELQLLVDFGESLESVIKSLEKDGYVLKKLAEQEPNENFCRLLTQAL